MCLSKVLVGICAHNEQNNIGGLLQNLILEQDLSENCRIVVVCSGCNDKTPQIVKELEKRDARIKKGPSNWSMGDYCYGAGEEAGGF